ncbi:MAG: hypothetical protein IKX47_02880 [Oscillospiraceae bacterium]|nr:hypothetical protein [Oscillospiraceae bacterium]
MRLQWTWFLFALFFLLMFFLHGCAGKAPDGETTALIEASDAVCLVTAGTSKTSYDQKTVIPLPVCEDYLGNISSLGRDLHLDDLVTVYVAVDHDWYIRVFLPWVEEARNSRLRLRLVLFLDVWEEDYIDGHPLFVPHGGEETILRESRDADGLRYLEALRAYGKSHPREAESWTLPYPPGLWVGPIPID